MAELLAGDQLEVVVEQLTGKGPVAIENQHTGASHIGIINASD